MRLPMRSRQDSQQARLALAVVALLLLAGCGGGGSTTTTPDTIDAAHTITIARHGLFAPFILVVQANSTVKWVNHDGVAHHITTTPLTRNYLNPTGISLVAPAGGKVLFPLTHPGLYQYFDDTEATWDARTNRVSANLGAPNYPLAMEGLIWVQGTIAGLAKHADNPLGAQSDQYTQEFIAIAKGGTVTWHNPNTDPQAIDTVTGWTAPINPVDIIGQTPLKGTNDDPPYGETRTFTFTTTGLYYYYCSLRASVDPASHRAKAFDESQGGATDFPEPMEGFVLVGG